VEVEEGRTFTASPLPWQKRNDFGDTLIKQHTTALNDAIKLYVEPDTNIPELEAKLYERVNDPIALLQMGYPESKPKDFDGLSWRQLIELLLVALEVNELKHLSRLIDPNLISPTVNGGTPSVGEPEEMIGQKIESLVDSSSPDSNGTLSQDSPTEKSSVSSPS
jgi:hypothetical protein